MGKLSRRQWHGESADEWWQRREDLLTADVFRAFRYLPVAVVGRLFLECCIDVSGQTLRTWLRRHESAIAEASELEVVFWPRTDDGKEPDILLLLGPRDARVASVLVEAKLHSPQSTIGGRSQVGHYVRKHLCDEFDDDRVDDILPPLRAAVYLTGHLRRPDAELSVVVSDCRGLEACDPIAIFWTSWQRIASAVQREFRREEHPNANAQVRAILRDLRDDLQARGFGAQRSFESILPKSKFISLAPIRRWPFPVAQRQHWNSHSRILPHVQPLGVLTLPQWGDSVCQTNEPEVLDDERTS